MKPKWMEIAEGEIGQHEVKGGENPRILEYHAATTLEAREDEIPWCSSFVNWCFQQAGIEGTRSAAAISWTKWGEMLATPREGCVVVIRQRFKGGDGKTGSASGNHVAFFKGLENGAISLLGGNQGDSVKVSNFRLASYQVLAYRWPKETA